MTLRVVVADDHPMYRYGVSAVLEHSDAVSVVAQVGSGRELLVAVAQHRPDVVVTDLGMPDLDGAEATARLLHAQPDLAVLVLTMHEDDEHVHRALRAGARGYLVKGADGDSIVRAVCAVAGGQAVYGAEVARRITGFYSADVGGSPTARAFPELTPRERDVLEQLVAGRRNSEIAARTGMAEKTVRNHVSQILLKLAVPDRTAAALKAKDAGVEPAAGPTDDAPEPGRRWPGDRRP